MNLATNPWIPAVRSDGSRDLYSLRELFAVAHELRDLAVKPHERIALMRLLICITHAALDGPTDEVDWDECEPRIQPSVVAYLDKWEGSFELFGDGPRFLQQPVGAIGASTPVMENEGIARLNLCLASGESAHTLFDNASFNGRSIDLVKTALHLLTYQCFSPLLGRGYKGRSPCADASALHSLLLGRTLIETVRSNLITHEIILNCYEGVGRPIWEVWDSLAKVATQKMLTNTFLGRLVPLARSLWLENDTEITLSNGFVYPGFDESGYRENTTTTISRKNIRAVLRSDVKRAKWRDLPAICIAQKNQQSGPLALRLSNLGNRISLWCGGMIFPKDQAKILDVIESVYNLPTEMFSEFGRAAYERGVTFANEWEFSLKNALKEYAATLKVVSPAYDQASQFFWTRLEQHLSDLFEIARNVDLVADLPACKWGQAVKAAAQDAYQQCSARQTPRQIEAYARGLRKLTVYPKSQPTPAAHE